MHLICLIVNIKPTQQFYYLNYFTSILGWFQNIKNTMLHKERKPFYHYLYFSYVIYFFFPNWIMISRFLSYLWSLLECLLYLGFCLIVVELSISFVRDFGYWELTFIKNCDSNIPSRIHLVPLTSTSQIQLVNTIMDRLATDCTYGTWE